MCVVLFALAVPINKKNKLHIIIIIIMYIKYAHVAIYSSKVIIQKLKYVAFYTKLQQLLLSWLTVVTLVHRLWLMMIMNDEYEMTRSYVDDYGITVVGKEKKKRNDFCCSCAHSIQIRIIL